MIKEHDKCEICKTNLKYLDNPIKLKCNFCGAEKSTNILCPNNHFICDDCHSKDAIKVIEVFCKNTDLTDPYKIADEIMKHPNFWIYGPEHHVLVPAVVLTCLKNLKIKKPNRNYITDKDILNAIQRAKKLPGGWCGFYGSCGAGVGSGIAISIFTGATPATDIHRSTAILTTSRCFVKIADNLEHCCKRSVRISIGEFLNILNEKFNIELDFSPTPCIFSKVNDKCEREKCSFFN